MTSINTPSSIQDAYRAARAAAARNKFTQLIEQGQAQVTAAMDALLTQQPKDAMVPATRLEVEPGANASSLRILGEGGGQLHRHALDQVVERAGLPTKWAHTMLDDHKRPDILADTLNSLYKAPEIIEPKSRFLVRSINGEVRGFLSDKYRRLDSAPIVEALAETALQYGAIPMFARHLDTRFALQLALPAIHEPVPGELMLYGLTFQNSDVGDGALSLRGWILRLICTNGAMAEEGIRQVHLGRRLSDNISWSDETMRLDSAAMASAVRDVVGGLLQPAAVRAKMEQIKTAAGTELDINAALTRLRRSQLTKGEAEKVAELYNSADVELMPAGNTAWRLSNALSLFAQQPEVSGTRSLDLQRLAGEVAGIAVEAKAA